ncbi:MAG: cytochrome P450 [Chloroflexi bacterium]|nr:cytochrome P450 [Chloroflexota bacterium]
MPATATPDPAARPRIRSQHAPGGLLGLQAELRRDPLGLLVHCTRDYGDFVRMRLGLTRTVLVGHPSMLEEVLVTRSGDFRKNVGTRRLRAVLGNGLLVSEGDVWQRQRQLMLPAFHQPQLDRLAATVVSTVSRALDQWHRNKQRDLYAEMSEITLHVVARSLFGIDIAPDVARIRESSQVLTAHLRSRLFSLMTLVPDRLPTPGNVRYSAAVRGLDALVYRHIAARRAAGRPDTADLLDVLLTASDEAGRGLSERQVRDEVLTVISAGYDTTALALTWAFILLARHPIAEACLQAEVDTVLDGRAPTAADVSQLRYVQCVVDETLRLYPSAWVIGREAIRDTEIGGQRVRRGTSVLLSPWVLHRDARFFDEPTLFRPERWADAMKRVPRFAYIPFGAGPRTCIGRGFARLELSLALATITQRYRVELAEPARPIDVVPVLTLQPRGHVWARLAAR